MLNALNTSSNGLYALGSIAPAYINLHVEEVEGLNLPAEGRGVEGLNLPAEGREVEESSFPLFLIKS